MGKTSTIRRGGVYLGVDVGGTKIQASLALEAGVVLARRRLATPREGGVKAAVGAIRSLVHRILDKQAVAPEALRAIGVVVPGVVDPDRGRVVSTANMDLSGAELVRDLEADFGVPVALGNDCNVATLGEKWLGAARRADSAVGIFVGTGIGGGFVAGGQMWRGRRETALEVGHMIMQVGGPKCGCGNRGCFEALASRTAIERDLRDAVAGGRKTALKDILDGDLGMIRSGALGKALARGDELVAEVLGRAAEVIGYACQSINHLLDPEAIVLGGGVTEACGDFLLPIVQKVVDADPLPGTEPPKPVLLSALGDDAGVLGAVAMARQRTGRDPFNKRFAVAPKYPKIALSGAGKIKVGRETLSQDFHVRVNGKVKARKAGKRSEASDRIGLKELLKACAGGPGLLIVATDRPGKLRLDDDAAQYLTRRAVECQILPTADAVTACNASRQRHAAIFRTFP